MTSALLLEDGTAITVGGLTLIERGAVLAHRAGFSPIYVWSAAPFDAPLTAPLHSRGVPIVRLPYDAPPLQGIPDVDDVVVIAPSVLLDPTVLRRLADPARSAGGRAAAVFDDAGAPLLLFATAHAAVPRASTSIEAMAAGLAARDAVQAVSVENGFCRRVTRGDAARELERQYTRHMNGGEDESYFTKKIRRFSVPLSSALVQVGARPAHVTLGGLALAAASAWFIARGSYAAGVVGGVLYYTSMIFDCSDGEVARLTLRDSSFGAWLETVVDYLTYVLVLVALVAAAGGRSDEAALRSAAALALGGSLVVIAVAGYLRHRVAAADPGQFDDASARAMASAGRLHRFARWGRQWIKRSTLAHLLVALAVVNQLPALLYLWAFGAAVASVVILAVEPFVVRTVAVAAARGGNGHE
jgi:phosphatidylglycerophosphate synthase